MQTILDILKEVYYTQYSKESKGKLMQAWRFNYEKTLPNGPPGQ